MRALLTVGLLVVSNVFMTYAWYYHLKRPAWPLATAIVASWGIAFFEYVLQVPANRYGHLSHAGPFSAPQLKVIQEAITLAVFTVFTLVVLRERPSWNDAAAFGLIFLAVAVSMLGRGPEPGRTAHGPEPAATGRAPDRPAP
ncbi:MAG TPA: DMT family protein [Phycisphaerales bacterium]|nr:DMT family protein [Phycisphaerales bacterium]